MFRLKNGVIFLLVLCMLPLGLAGCGGFDNKSPEAVVKSMIKAYQDQDQETVEKCLGLSEEKKADEEIQKEIDYNMSFFKAHKADKISFEKAEALGDYKDSHLIYVWYNYEIKGEKVKQILPCLSFYFVNGEEKDYFVIPARDVNDEMSQYSREEYGKFKKTDTYGEYQEAYKKFKEDYPDYEEELDENFKALQNEKK